MQVLGFDARCTCLQTERHGSRCRDATQEKASSCFSCRSSESITRQIHQLTIASF